MRQRSFLKYKTLETFMKAFYQSAKRTLQAYQNVNLSSATTIRLAFILVTFANTMASSSVTKETIVTTTTQGEPMQDGSKTDRNSNVNDKLSIMTDLSSDSHSDCGNQQGGNHDDNDASSACAPLQDVPEPGAISARYIRSPLARAVYHKLKEDERNKNDRHVYWYRVIVSRLSPELQDKFVQFDQDAGADEFLQHCEDKSDSVLTQLFHALARSVLNLFMTQTSVNGLLHRGSMYIFSRSQFEKLMGYPAYFKGTSMLDLGAGDGMVTKEMASYFNTTYATEMSGVMARRLSGLGYQVLGVDEWPRSGLQFDLVSCLNLLDRCDRPLTLLQEVKAVLRPGTGRLLVAVVIPFKPYVEFESQTHEPTEYLRVNGSNFEEQIEQFASIFWQAGFAIERFTRLPYLCEGDLRHSFYVLTDALFVLRPLENSDSS